MSGKIKVLVAEPGKPCEARVVEDELKALQAVVGGNLETVSTFNDPIVLVCNEEGKLLGLPPNRPLMDSRGRPYDILCGTFFIAGVEGENFCSLSDAQIRQLKSMFDQIMIAPAEKAAGQRKKGGKLHER